MIAVTVAVAVATLACGGRPSRDPNAAPRPARAPTESAIPAARRSAPTVDGVQLYRQMGLLAVGGATPFVGSIAFLATPSSDSTLVLLTISLASQALTFTREGDRYRASYGVVLELRSTGASNVATAPRRVEGKEDVRVGAFKETTRVDESILFRQSLKAAPGTYALQLSVRDEFGNKTASVEASLGIPRLGNGGLSSPIPFYEATPRSTLDSLPRIAASPRATVTFGVDTVVPVYVETYGATSERAPLALVVRGDGDGAVLWRDTTSLAKHGANKTALHAGAIYVPVSPLGVGAMTLRVARTDTRDSATAPIFVSFGAELPVATFTEMLEYLRYYASSTRLATLRSARPETRGTAWGAFLRETDPAPDTPQHEGLRDYFGRVAQANARFRDEGGPGWLTDRGRVFITLGPPEQTFDPSGPGVERGRTQVWDYRRQRVHLVFIDQSGFGRWTLTPSSEAEFASAMNRLLVK